MISSSFTRLRKIFFILFVALFNVTHVTYSNNLYFNAVHYANIALNDNALAIGMTAMYGPGIRVFATKSFYLNTELNILISPVNFKLHSKGYYKYPESDENDNMRIRFAYIPYQNYGFNFFTVLGWQYAKNASLEFLIGISTSMVGEYIVNKNKEYIDKSNGSIDVTIEKIYINDKEHNLSDKKALLSNVKISLKEREHSEDSGSKQQYINGTINLIMQEKYRMPRSIVNTALMDAITKHGYGANDPEYNQQIQTLASIEKNNNWRIQSIFLGPSFAMRHYIFEQPNMKIGYSVFYDLLFPISQFKISKPSISDVKNIEAQIISAISKQYPVARNIHKLHFKKHVDIGMIGLFSDESDVSKSVHMDSNSSNITRVSQSSTIYIGATGETGETTNIDINIDNAKKLKRYQMFFVNPKYINSSKTLLNKDKAHTKKQRISDKFNVDIKMQDLDITDNVQLTFDTEQIKKIPKYQNSKTISKIQSVIQDLSQSQYIMHKIGLGLTIAINL